MLDVIGRLPADMAMIMVEHDMQVVRRFASRVTVLVRGAVLMTGSPADVMAAEAVRSVYLGRTGHARFHGSVHA
jgi:branched-chain amino acid transport system ATP-binding protein